MTGWGGHSPAGGGLGDGGDRVLQDGGWVMGGDTVVRERGWVMSGVLAPQPPRKQKPGLWHFP